jgi:hypothetical protein
MKTLPSLMRASVTVAWMLFPVALLGAACQSRSNLNAERDVLWKEAEAIAARHAAFDSRIATWSEAVGAWAKQNAADIDPARIVLALSSRSYFLHARHSSDTADTDAAYVHLEDQMKEIQETRSRIDADWRDLITRDRAWFARAGQKPVEHQVTFDYEFGDSTIPIPGVSARQSCCSLTTKIPGETNCKLNSEFCVKPANRKWKRVCVYICSVQAIQ